MGICEFMPCGVFRFASLLLLCLLSGLLSDLRRICRTVRVLGYRIINVMNGGSGDNGFLSFVHLFVCLFLLFLGPSVESTICEAGPEPLDNPKLF
jgi:hypothetical protein